MYMSKDLMRRESEKFCKIYKELNKALFLSAKHRRGSPFLSSPRAAAAAALGTGSAKSGGGLEMAALLVFPKQRRGAPFLFFSPEQWWRRLRGGGAYEAMATAARQVSSLILSMV